MPSLHRLLIITITLALPFTAMAKTANPHIHYVTSSPCPPHTASTCHRCNQQYIKVDRKYEIPRPYKHCSERFLGMSKGQIVAVLAAVSVIAVLIIIGNAKNDVSSQSS